MTPSRWIATFGALLIATTLWFVTIPVGASVNWTGGAITNLPSSLPVEDLSGLTIDDSGRLWSVVDKADPAILAWTHNGAGWVNTVAIDLSTVAGSSLVDPEGISMVASHPGAVNVELAIVDEATHRIEIIDIAGQSASLSRAVDLSPMIAVQGNDGLEGIAYAADESDPATDIFYVAHESNSTIHRVAATRCCGAATVTHSHTVASLADISGLAIGLSPESLLVLSHESHQLVEIDRLGGSATTVVGLGQFAKPEGVAVDAAAGQLFVVGEHGVVDREFSSWQHDAAPPNPGNQTTDYTVARGTHDAEIGARGQVNLNSGDLDIAPGSTTALRFENVCIDSAAVVNDARLVMTADEADSAPTLAEVRAVLAVDPPELSRGGELVGLAASAPVLWDIDPVQVGDVRTSPDLSDALGALAAVPGRPACSDVVILISGTGDREFVSWETSPTNAPTLVVGLTNDAPLTPTPAPATPVPATPVPPTPVPPTPVPTAGLPMTTVATIAHPHDDAEQQRATMTLGSGDLDIGANRLIGLRYELCVPQGATIATATLTLRADEPDDETTSTQVAAQQHDDAPPFTSASNDLSNRAAGPATTWDSLPIWQVGSSSVSPDLSDVIAGVTNRPGWAACQHLVLILDGVGDREAISYETDPAGAPTLTVGWTQ